MLLVTGKKENVKSKIFEAANSENVGITQIAKGGLGRLVVYTESAITELNEKFKGK